MPFLDKITSAVKEHPHLALAGLGGLSAFSKSPASYDLTGKMMKGIESGTRMGLKGRELKMLESEKELKKEERRQVRDLSLEFIRLSPEKWAELDEIALQEMFTRHPLVDPGKFTEIIKKGKEAGLIVTPEVAEAMRTQKGLKLSGEPMSQRQFKDIKDLADVEKEKYTWTGITKDGRLGTMKDVVVGSPREQTAKRLKYEKTGPITGTKEKTIARIRAEAKAKREIKPEYTPGQALKQINTVLKAKATIDKGNMITDALFTMIAKEDPDAAKDILPFLNKELSDEERADLEEIWKVRIEYLMPFVPEASRPKISWLAKKPMAKEIKGRAIVERRTYKGKTLIKYSDGSIEYEK